MSAATGRGVKAGVVAIVKVNDLSKAQRVLVENGTTQARTVQRKPSVRRTVFVR